MPHGNRGRRKSERLQIRMRYVVEAKIYRTEGEQRAARIRALHNWFENDGMTPPNDYEGVRIIGMWRNPDNDNELHAEWKTSEDAGQSLSEFYRTFHGKDGALFAIWQQNKKDYFNVGAGENKRKAAKPKVRRRIVSKVVKRKDGAKFVRTNRVAKRKTKKSVRREQKRRKDKG